MNRNSVPQATNYIQGRRLLRDLFALMCLMLPEEQSYHCVITLRGRFTPWQPRFLEQVGKYL